MINIKKKLFVVSDIHSFYTPLMNALGKSGFDPTNKNHWLIVCGDAFDRGSESRDVLNFLMSLERAILIRGNHEVLFEECCMRGYPYSNDKSNGTVRTICDLGGGMRGREFDECCESAWHRTSKYRAKLKNYFETENYIFVHSWIPTLREDTHLNYLLKEPKLKIVPDWRNASDKEWESAMWRNPFEMATKKLLPEKTVVFGHWHCSTGHKMSGNCTDEFKNAIWSPYYGEGFIGIDRCTAYTNEVNVLVLEDNFIESHDSEKTPIVEDYGDGYYVYCSNCFELIDRGVSIFENEIVCPKCGQVFNK